MVFKAPQSSTLRLDRICLFLPSLEGGGAERMILVLANGFSRRGYSVDIVLAQAKGPFLREVSSEVNVIDLKASRTLMALPGLMGYLRRERPAVMLSTLSNANVIALIAGRFSGVSTRLVVREACTLATIEAGKYVAKAMQWTYPWAERVIVISNGVGDYLSTCIGLTAQKMQAIYNPAITASFSEKVMEPIDHPWFQPGEPPVILGVGRLTVQKDFPTLIRAFADVRAKRVVRLVVLGEGKDRVELEALVKSLGVQDDVALPGFVDNPYPYMRAAALFVLSSQWEGFGNVLAEAMACGTPVVSTDCPSGPNEILENGRWGTLVPMDNWIALSGAIVDRMDSNAPVGMVESVMNRFHEDRITEEYLDVLIGNRP